jgi:hypothetical protein
MSPSFSRSVTLILVAHFSGYLWHPCTLLVIQCCQLLKIIFCLRLVQIVNHIIGFEVLTAVVMKGSIFWDITLCSPLKVNRRFGRVSSLHIQRRRKKPPWTRFACYLFHAGLFLGLYFDPENEGDMFLRNVGSLSMGYTPLYLHPSLTFSFSLILLMSLSHSLHCR